MVLRGVSLRIRPGEFVAIVGDSGSGKSSLLALLQRFYDPTGGAVAVGGEDVRGVAVAAHRRRIAMLSQDLTLFSESILFNIAVGLVDALLDTTRDADPSAVRRAVEAACQKVGMHEFIMSLPEGYATRCTRSGAGLSGGQIQRLALARALVRDPQILVLDEPTSALDVCSEETVMRAVLEARGGAQGRRTVVMVAHRLATVVAADRIVVMRRGKVAEVGTHDELMARGGVYAGMAMQQGL
ncbi:hypothetical protein DRE_06476 [Drechslerella stenobrocha 248]|uniref:ABC transporter domain-containing protein n=1 Tax=Drechslerella stenobrocha 248 TaxID=1043628 RepID=W7HY25_9PEZI|nr:hypothetical protein DRE_06476 [Drechslerella stenobrocha 248]